MKNVLVTGGCGFIGSNFVNIMVRKYPNLHFYNLDCLYYCGSIKNIDEDVAHASNYTFIKGKLQDKDLITHVLNFHQIDTVVHFAAQSHVDNSFTDSLAYTYDNIYGTHILLECCRVYGKIEKFVHISTDEVYGESEFTDFDKKTETSMLCPTNPYAATKAASELIARSYYFSFKMPVVITRGNNVFGPRQYIEKVIPRFIHLLSSNKKCTLHGNGSSKRAFIYVDDVASAVETIMLTGVVGEVYNIGTPEELEIKELAKLLIKRIKGSDANIDEWLECVEDRHFNDKRYYISDEKLKSLGWNSAVTFEEGLEKTLAWYNQTTVAEHWAVGN
jgi:dTDP-glucose 4,6-dehydratase